MPSRRLRRWLAVDASPPLSGSSLTPGFCSPLIAKDLELGLRVARRRPDVRKRLDEPDPDEERRRRERHREKAPLGGREHDEPERQCEVRGSGVRPQKAGVDDQRRP